MKNVNVEFEGEVSLNKKVKLYKKVFGDFPWNEGFICNACNAVYSKKFTASCSCGDSLLVPFYKNDELRDDFTQLSREQGYQELVAEILDDYIGFIWGWKTSLSYLNQKKLGLNETEEQSLLENILNIYSDFDASNFYYFAEIGVDIEFRGKDIAGQLYKENVQKLIARGDKYILVRTTKKSDLPYKWFKDMGYQDVYFYEDTQDRVILVYKI